jgi:hypothetical protein
MFKEWIEEQKDKAVEKGLKEKKPQRSRRQSKADLQRQKSDTPFDAIRKSGKFGKRLNYPVVKRMFAHSDRSRLKEI